MKIINDKKGPEVRLLEDPVLKQTITSNILGFWPNRQNDHFPAPLPVSIERKDFYRLKQYPYLISLKSDGYRFLMVNYNNRTYMVDRSFRFFEVSLLMPEYSRTDNINFMLDGELVEETTTGNWLYLIHDCLCVHGNDVSQAIFNIRYESANEILMEYLDNLDDQEESSGESFKLSLKKFYNFSEINTVKKIISGISPPNHKIDGVIFTPRTLPVGTGTQYTLFKWKPREHHTFDFKIIESEFEFIAYVCEKKEDSIYASVDKNIPQGKQFEAELKALNFESGDIVECDYKSLNKGEPPMFHPILLRKDKTHPNSLNTVEKTIDNIKENITFNELVDIINS